MEPVSIITGTAVPARPLRRRHRPDHPERLAEAGRAHRLRRRAVLRVARRPRASSSTTSSSPGPPILVAGPNFGIGSSREHAVWAIMDYGFEAVISPRFGDIFRNNCTKNGLVPVRCRPRSSRPLLRRRRGRPDPRDHGRHRARRVVERAGPRHRRRRSRSTTPPGERFLQGSTTSASPSPTPTPSPATKPRGRRGSPRLRCGPTPRSGSGCRLWPWPGTWPDRRR